MTDAAIQSVLEFGNFSEAELDLLRSKFRVVNYYKNGLLVTEGQICQAFYFILNGSCRHYYVNGDNEQIIVNLYPRHTWLTEFTSFTSQKPSKYNIQAFEDCQVIQFGIHDMHELILKHPPFFRLGRIIDQLKYPDYSNKSPQKAYEALLLQHPQMVLKFPLKDIASLLKITPETLSRVRAKAMLPA